SAEVDPRTGAILASVSVPAYDANQVADPSKQEAAFDQLSHDPNHALLNRAAQGLYPPGSIFKVVTGAAALENGFDPTKKLRVDDPYQADKSWGDYFVRSASHAHGLFDMSDGFRLSENIYFAQVGLQIGGGKLTEYAKRFGVGATPKLDLPAATGQLSDSAVLDRPRLLPDAQHGWSVGFAPAAAPTVVVAVIVENAPDGGVTAAPLGGQVIRAALGK